jgi:YebC/PmpR family DNA-binding regulatory protein
MGRIFEKRKARMFARWSKTSKAFTKLGKELAIAVKMGGIDPASNPRLRMAMQTARSLNMPKDRIQNAIERASSKDEAALEEITYEGYGPHGIAIFVECTTNNPTRTVANVRNYLSKHGGNLATDGALKFLFSRQGIFRIKPPAMDPDELQLELIDHGLEEMFESEEGDLLLYTSFEEFGTLQKALEERKIEVVTAGLQRTPLNTTELPPEQEKDILKIVNLLEEDDDVQHVYHNMAVSDEEE